MVHYQEARVKLANAQLNKVKSAAKINKNNTRTVLRVQDKNATWMSADIKLSKGQL